MENSKKYWDAGGYVPYNIGKMVAKTLGMGALKINQPHIHL